MTKAPLAPKKTTQKKAPKKQTQKSDPKPEVILEPEAVKDQVLETPPEPETQAETPEVEKAFSSGDIEEINAELGIEETDELGEGEEPAADTPEGAEIISLAEREQAAKDLFYGGLCGGLDFANNRITSGMDEGPYQSLNLKSYGDVGRAASDQFFDRLCDVPIFKRMLFKLNENALMEKWGAILMLGYTMFSNFKTEQSARMKALKEREKQSLKDKAA